MGVFVGVSVGVRVGSDVKVDVRIDNMVEEAAVGLVTGAFELHEDMTTPTVTNKSNDDFNVFIFDLKSMMLSNA